MEVAGDRGSSYKSRCKKMKKKKKKDFALDRLLRSHLARIRSRARISAVQSELLSVFPLLLRQESGVAALAAEILGVLAIDSLETNEVIASDGAIIRALIAALSDPSQDVAMAACHAISDLSAAHFAREQLRKSSAVEKLLSLLSQVASERGRNRGIGPSPLLDAAMILINTCDNHFLEKIPKDMTRRFLPLAKELWRHFKNQRGSSSSPCEHDLAETIFRLSMNIDGFSSCPSDLLRTTIFGRELCHFESFTLNHWENSPILLRNELIEGDVISSCFDLGSGSRDAALEGVLSASVSCPPLASDELDIVSFLEEVKGCLGRDMVNGQDIRLVKIKEELQFCDGEGLSVDQIMSKCKKALESGYTVALRGLEFRSMALAGISDGLAVLFGQPSVGANIYLTPPGSQGLARHYDDHCVFICQLLGTKRWTVSPRSTPLLPRLYEPLGGSSSSVSRGSCGDDKEFVLREGDILYIPRGCPHEAQTFGDIAESPIEMSTFSLHLTLGIEVEPPFEWEGFTHTALHCWAQNQRENRRPLVISLLHLAIGLIGERSPILRGACLVLAPCSASAIFCDSQRSIFCSVLASIEAQSVFEEAREKAEMAVNGTDDRLFQRLRWLRHLPTEGVDFEDPLEVVKEILLVTHDEVEALEAEFTETKNQFCRSADFEDAMRIFEILQKRYRKVRRQYMNGMLALHHAD
ncbi:uncharacterized protein LOC144709663 isoform X2 [Wolffia australiana]